MASRRREQRRPTAAATRRSAEAIPQESGPVAVAGWRDRIGDVLCVVLISFWLAQFLGLLIRVLVRG